MIVVAVRSTGRVRMHKARENTNGTYSIGKTWNLEDLTAVETFANQDQSTVPSYAIERGVTITVGKPYFWLGETLKEKDFFVASLIKIFRKYTKGRTPDLIGFDENQQNRLLGLPPVQQAQQNGSRRSITPPPLDPARRSTNVLTDQRHQSTASDQSMDIRKTSQASQQPRQSQDGTSYRQRIPSSRQMSDQGLGIRHDSPPRQVADRTQVNGPQSDMTNARPTSRTRQARPAPPSPVEPSTAESEPESNGYEQSEPASGGSTPTPINGKPTTRQSTTTSNRVGSHDSSRNDTVDSARTASIDSRDGTDKLGLTDSRRGSPSPGFQAEPPPRRRPPLQTRNYSASTTATAESAAPQPLSTVTPVSHNDLPLRKESAGEEITSPPSVASDQAPDPGTAEETPSSAAGDSAMTTDDSPQKSALFKNKTGAAVMRAAVTKISAFKPRAGGAAERLKKLTGGQNDSDTMQSVAPAPVRRPAAMAQLRQDSTTSTISTDSRRESENAPVVPIIAREIQKPPAVMTTAIVEDDRKDSLTSATRVVAKPRRRNLQQEKYLSSLGIDPLQFGDAGLDFETIMLDFGWNNEILQPAKLDQLEADIKREIGRTEAGSWLQHIEQKDNRMEMVDKMLDKAIAECDELDGLLTLYSVELSTLNEDIAYIEAQSQGLQVQTANQKLLQSELENLTRMMSVSPDVLAVLDSHCEDDLDATEKSLGILYTAMLTINPNMKGDAQNALQTNDKVDSVNLMNMHALQERFQVYKDESDRFCQQLNRDLSSIYYSALQQAIPALMQSGQRSGRGSPWSLNPAACNAGRAGLWRYGPILLYTQEVSNPSWITLLNSYSDIARPLYQSVATSTLDSLRKSIMPFNTEDGGVLFTSKAKLSADGLDKTGRKISMKRSQTFMRSGRASTSDKSKPITSGQQMASEAFASMLSEWCPILITEQNFIVDLFHASTLDTLDFIDAVRSAPPDQRVGPSDLLSPRGPELDRNMADQVAKTMQSVFDFWPAEVIIFVEDAISTDPIQAVGLMATLAVFSSSLVQTNQEFLMRILNDASSRVESSFARFIDQQVKAIEETSIVVNKRKGVISFFKVFPQFSIALENTYSAAVCISGNNSAVGDSRRVIDEAYTRINTSMWDSLKQISKQSSTAAGLHQSANQGAEAEDKEMINYQVLLIDNMNHFAEEVDDEGNVQSILTEWKVKAVRDRTEHIQEYIRLVIRRPLGKLLVS